MLLIGASHLSKNNLATLPIVLEEPQRQYEIVKEEICFHVKLLLCLMRPLVLSIFVCSWKVVVWYRYVSIPSVYLM